MFKVIEKICNSHVICKSLCVAISIIMAVSCTGCKLAEQNMEDSVTKKYLALAIESVEKYQEKGLNYTRYLPEGKYNCFGDFFNWSQSKIIRESDSIHIDDAGIVMVKYNGNFQYNPCTIMQYALGAYGRYIRGEETAECFLDYAEYTLNMQEVDGSFRYYFDYNYYLTGKDFKSGWTSAMDSGHALAIFARAYHLTQDEKWCKAAERTLNFLKVPIEQGGTAATLAALDPSLTHYTIYEEYPCTPPSYTLNGYMFTLIGIYDWSCVNSPTKKTATKMFNEGIKTLVAILPYYDIGGFTAYDLGHITHGTDIPHIGLNYHSIHVAFCRIFHDITGKQIFNDYYKLWASYVD